ncbi:hypothetical protein QYZ88_016295 [Lachnospiraceae bacterium C1.1]|nr:hypothetical protein [Lachnospiraceae bacterium C1.1]
MEDRKIIGGEFCIYADAMKKSIRNNLLPQFSLGRTCLYAILDAVKSKVGGVLLPDYMCSSVVEVPLRLGIPIKHYHINTNSLLPDISGIKGELKKGETIAIVLITYFGMIDLDSTIIEINSNFPNTIIIVDDVQNYYGFGNHIDYDYCFTSYRKWFSVPDGADIMQNNKKNMMEVYSQKNEYAIYKASGNLLKNHVDMIGDKISLELIEKGENMMDEEYRFGCSEIGSKLLKRVDTELTAKKRIKNANTLHEGLLKLGIKHLYNADRVPLFIPIMVYNRNKIRKALFSENIFSPIHWPNKDAKIQGSNELYETELSLICDQRYNEEDMERILRGIENAV